MTGLIAEEGYVYLEAQSLLPEVLKGYRKYSRMYQWYLIHWSDNIAWGGNMKEKSIYGIYNLWESLRYSTTFMYCKVSWYSGFSNQILSLLEDKMMTCGD